MLKRDFGGNMTRIYHPSWSQLSTSEDYTVQYFELYTDSFTILWIAINGLGARICHRKSVSEMRNWVRNGKYFAILGGVDIILHSLLIQFVNSKFHIFLFRALIFTQMTKMLDVLESFLNYHGHIYVRLDGTTKVEQRQVWKLFFSWLCSQKNVGSRDFFSILQH